MEGFNQGEDHILWYSTIKGGALPNFRNIVGYIYSLITDDDDDDRYNKMESSNPDLHHFKRAHNTKSKSQLRVL